MTLKAQATYDCTIIYDGLPTDVVEITACPVCGFDRFDLSGNGYECCRCGVYFEPDYSERANA